MTDQPDAPTLDELSHEAAMPACLIEGLDPLQNSAEGDPDIPTMWHAQNAMKPIIYAAIERAWALCRNIESAEIAARKSGKL